MLSRFSRMFTKKKSQPIRNSKLIEKKVRPSVETLEDRMAPATIAQWSFTGSTAAPINTQNGSTGNTVNQFSAGATGGPTTGTGTLETLGMFNAYNGGNSAADDVLSTPGTAVPSFSEFTLRIRGTTHNGWATHAAGAAEYTQGLEFDTSTAGQSGIIVSFDWYSTNQAIRDLQVQYTTDGSTWTNYVAPGGNGSNGISTSGTFIATPNDFWGAAGSVGNVPVVVNLSSVSAVNNDPNFGIRLVSAYDSTGNVPNDYAGASLVGGVTQIYNNNSGNWRFDNLTVSSGQSTASVLSATPAAPQIPGTSITLNDVITPSSGSVNPTGTVQFFDGGSPIGSAQNVTSGTGNTGVASITINTSGSPLSLGAHSFTAVYSATGSFSGGTSNIVTYTIGDPTSTSVISSPSSPETYSASSTTTFTATVVPANIGGTSSPIGNPSGFVKFFDNGVLLTNASFTDGHVPLTADGGDNNSTASIIITGLTSGTHNITAQYVVQSGANFVGSTSSALPFVVSNGASGPFTPGNLVILQAGDGVNAYQTQAPLFLDEVTPTGTVIQQVSIPATGGQGNPNNQPITLDLSASAGNGQLARSYDGSALTFDGVDSTVDNGGLTSGSPTGQDDRVVAVLTGDPTVASNLDTTTHGQFYVGDDNRGSVAESPTGPIYTAGHPNQAGGAVSQGVHEFDTTGPSIGTQVSATTNVRGINIGFDNRMYLSTAGGIGGTAALNTAGIFTEAQALPTSANANPASDVQVVPALFSASKLGGIALADMNGDGIVDNGDRLYFVDDGTVGGAGTGGLYVATWNDSITANPWNTPNNAAAVAAGIVDHWSVPVRLGDAPIQDGSGNVGQLRGITATVVSSGIASASETGTTVTIDLGSSPLPSSFVTNANVQISGVGAGFDGSWTITGTSGNTFTYTANVSGLSTVSGVGTASQAIVYTSAYDAAANDSSYIQQWIDTNTGVAIANAQITSGNTVKITTMTPNTFQTGQVVEVDGVGANNGAGAITSGYNGAWQITVIDSTHFTFSDTNPGASSLAQVNNQGGADVTVSATTVATLASGSDTSAGKSFGEVGLRGVAFAPVAATSVTLSQSPANPLNPGAAFTLTAVLTNSQVAPTGQVAFVDMNTNTVIGFGTISTVSGQQQASLTLPTGVVGNHSIQAYFAGGGTLALASARSNTIQVIQAGTSDALTTLASNISAVSVGHPVTLTATVTTDAAGDFGATGTVSFYNGSVAPGNLLGTSTLSTSGPTNGQATLTIAFNTPGTQTIIAIYNGDNTFKSGERANIPVTISVAPNATGAITSSANNVPVGSIQTFTATITGNATLGAPVGSVVFTLLSATSNTSGVALVNVSSSAITLVPGPNNTATAVWTGPALSVPGSYFVTFAYTASGATNPYSSFAVNTTSATSGTALVETAKQAFTPGNLVAVQRGDGTVNLGSNSYPVFLDEYTPSGTLVQVIAMPNVDAGTQHALFLSGQNSSEGLINRSANGYYLTLGGYDLPVGQTFITSTFPFQYPRTIARVDGSANVDTSTAVGTLNGSGVAATITSASATSTAIGATVTVNLSGTNFFLVGESVTISGITTSGYNGTYILTAATASQIKFLATSVLGAATAVLGSTPQAASPASAPYNPSDVVSNDGNEFWYASSLNTGNSTDSGVVYVSSLGASTGTEVGPLGKDADAITISGGQLYITKGSGDIQAIGTGLPTTAGQTSTGLPNLGTAYTAAFSKQGPEQVLLLNTNDGTSNNPNVAYIADQDNGILKFWLNSASVDQLSESGTTVTVHTSAANSLVTGQSVQISSASIAGYNGIFTITVTDGQDFTYTAATGLGTLGTIGGATVATASQWEYGGPGGSFGQKLIFAGGATGLVGYVVNPGPSAQIQLYVTGSNVTQQNPNQIDSFLDTHGSPAGSGSNGVDKGFNSGSVTNIAFVGGANPAHSPNGNENFAGLAFVPGYVTNTTLSDSGAGANRTFTATVTTPSAPTNVPTGVVVFSIDGVVVGQGTLSGGVATFTTASFPTTGSHVVTAAFQGDVKDGTSTGTLTQAQSAFTAGNLLATVVATSGATSIGEFTTAGGTAVQTVTFPSTGPNAFVEKGSPSATNSEGYITDSGDGHSATLVGYNVNAGGSTTTANAPIAVIAPNGSIETSTTIPASDTGGAVRAVVSADGLGMWVSTSNFIRYVPFGNSAATPSTQVSNYYASTNEVEIQNGALYAAGGAGAQSNGITALDGPVIVGSGLPTVAGQSATNTLSGFPITTDPSGNFPVTDQIAVSPDGNTIFVADSRTDGSGGLLEFFQGSPGSWTQLPNTNSGFQIGGTTTADSGLRALVVDWSVPSAPVIYGTTTAATANRIVKITGGTTDGNSPSFSSTTVETAAASTAFRGVTFAPTAPGAAASTTTLTVTGSPGSYPGNVTLSATVTGGSGTPTGYVSFRTSAGVEIGAAALVSGTATLTPGSNLQVPYSGTIVAVYTGNATYAASTNSKSATVNTDATTTTLAAQFTAVPTGVADTLTAQVTYSGASASNKAAPTGTVTFWQDAIGAGGTNLGTVALKQTIVNVSAVPTIEFVASIVDTFTTTGTHHVFAVYNGDQNFQTSHNASGSPDVSVVKLSTVTVTTNNASPAANGTTVRESVTVTGTGTTPTGTVQFYDNLLPIGSPVTLDGSGQAHVDITTSLLQQLGVTLLPGLQSITAIYSGDSSYFGGTGVYEQAVKAQTFGAGDQFVYRVGDGTTNLIAPAGNPLAGTASIGSTIYLDEINPAGSDGSNVVQSIILPTADGQGAQAAIHAIVGNGQQSATEQLTVSGDGGYLFFTGYDNNPLNGAKADGTGIGTTALGIPTVAGTIPTAVGRVDLSGNVTDIAYLPSVQGGGNFNGVYSPDGNQVYTSGFNGVTYSANFIPSAALQSATTITGFATAHTLGQALEPDGTNLAAVNGSTGATESIAAAFAGFPTAAATPTNLPGATAAAAETGNGEGQTSVFPIDVYFTHLDGAGAPAGINTMYVADDGPSFATGAITKWALVSGTWTVVDHVRAGTGNSAITFYYISGTTVTTAGVANNVTLYVTYGNGGNGDVGPGQLYKIVDTNGFNAPIGTGGLHSDSAPEVANVPTGSNETYHGAATFGVIHLTGSGTPVTATEGTSVTAPVATFTDPDDSSPEPVANYNAIINWGDGTSSAGTITSTGGNGYTVSGTHTYAVASASGTPYTVGISIGKTNWNGHLLLSTTATVGDAGAGFSDLSGKGVPLANLLENTSYTATVATFTDPIDFGGSPNPASDYTATIDWGDGSSPTAGTIALTNPGAAWPNAGSYTVTGTHTYSIYTITPYPISVTISSTFADNQNLHVGTTATVLDAFGQFNITGAGVNITASQATEGTQFTAPVATFNDPVPHGGTAAPVTNYSATIDWGDGTSPSIGTIVITNAATGDYRVDGTHTYAVATASGQAYPITVTIQGDGGTLTLNPTATVGEGDSSFSDLSGSGTDFSADANASFSGQVAAFSDPIDFGGSPNAGSTYTAIIDWGDGTGTSTGTITLTNPGAVWPNSGAYTVAGTHTYTSGGSFDVTITVSSNTEPDDQNLVLHATGTVTGSNPITISKVTLNGNPGSTTISSVSESGNTVTVVMAAADGFIANESVKIAGIGTAGYNGTFPVTLVDGHTFTYTDNAITDAASDTGGGTATNGLLGNQRSMVDSIVYTFNQSVTLDSGAFRIALTANVTVNGTTGQTVGTLPTVAFSNPSGDGITWVVAFSGSGVAGQSIADGVYDLTIDHTKVHPTAGSGTLGADETDTFYRLLGDALGFAANGGQGRVNNTDLTAFKNALGKVPGQTGYQPYFDFLQSGAAAVSNTDLTLFKLRLNAKTFAGFSPSI